MYKIQSSKSSVDSPRHFCKTEIVHRHCKSVNTWSPTSWHHIFPESRSWWPLWSYPSQFVAIVQHRRVLMPTHRNNCLLVSRLTCFFRHQSTGYSLKTISKRSQGFLHFAYLGHLRRRSSVVRILNATKNNDVNEYDNNMCCTFLLVLYTGRRFLCNMSFSFEILKSWPLVRN